jgi:hypothetical protein
MRREMILVLTYIILSYLIFSFLVLSLILSYLTQAGRLVRSKKEYTEPAVQYNRFVRKYVPNTEQERLNKIAKTTTTLTNKDNKFSRQARTSNDFSD